jgi:hypothetical protein
MMRFVRPPSTGPEGAFEMEPQLMGLNELRIAIWNWLGVRDDFRNWLQLGVQPAKGYENRRQGRTSPGERRGRD